MIRESEAVLPTLALQHQNQPSHRFSKKTFPHPPTSEPGDGGVFRTFCL